MTDLVERLRETADRFDEAADTIEHLEVQRDGLIQMADEQQARIEELERQQKLKDLVIKRLANAPIWDQDTVFKGSQSE